MVDSYRMADREQSRTHTRQLIQNMVEHICTVDIEHGEVIQKGRYTTWRNMYRMVHIKHGGLGSYRT